MQIIYGSSGYQYEMWGPPPPKSGVSSDSIKNYYTTKNKDKQLWIYAKEFPSVELNFTRYRKLTPKASSNFVKKTPIGFKFFIKASLYITHYKKLTDFGVWWTEFEVCLKIFEEANRLEGVLFQFHPSFKKNRKNLEKLENMKKVIPERFIIALEFRDSSWYSTSIGGDEDVHLVKLFEGNWIFATLHLPEVRGNDANFGDLSGGIHAPPSEVSANELAYHRFHGTYDYSHGTYGFEYLSRWREGLSPDMKKVYAYFNNTDTYEVEGIPEKGIPYSRGVPLGVQLTPSPIYDMRCISALV